MKFWKLIPLFIFALAVGACSGEAENASGVDADTAAAVTPAASTESAPKKEAAPVPVKAKSVTIPAGTELQVVLADALNSGKNNAGDEFTANLSAPIMVGGATVLDKGTKVQGKVVDAKGSGRVKGLASMSITLTSVAVGGKMVSLVTKDHAVEAEATKGRDATVIGGGAGIGAAIGALTGGKEGAAKGAAIGGAAGTGTVLVTKGKEVEFPVESKLSFVLDKAVTVTQ